MIKQKILHNFSLQAERYDSHAQIQAHAADKLVTLLRNRSKPDSILEIGCGTGLLTYHLNSWKPKLYLVSDISRNMVRQCQQRTPLNHFLVMDGELLAIDCTFDLTVSNFTFQWFSHLEHSLLELLNYSQCLAFSVPGPSTFQEWTQFCENHQLSSGVQPFLSMDDYKRIFAPYTLYHMENERHTLTFPHWLAFWKSVKGIGGHTPHKEHHPQNLTALKSVLSMGEATITYDIIYCIVER